MTGILTHVMEGFDRVLAYSKWAQEILHRSSPKLESAEQLPHGIDGSVFTPRNRAAARHGFGGRVHAFTPKGKPFSVPDDVLMIGIVATNNPRKDYGLGVAAAAEVARDRKVLLWIHTDVVDKDNAWSIPYLLNDFGLNKPNAVVLTSTRQNYSDELMSWLYSACDVTLGIGASEGFGLPLFESLACGVPCVHGNNGGAPEHMPKEFLVEPHAWRIEGNLNAVRPIFKAEDWAAKINQVAGMKTKLPEHLEWNNLWPRWADWLKRGIE
jgi:glycosyltransferase involved in cell wall biosynthesis